MNKIIQTAPPVPPLSLEKITKDISSQVLNKIETFKQAGEIEIPPGYSPANALKAANLILLDITNKEKKPALEVCSRTSIIRALIQMVVYGLSPLKKQCAFIVRDNKLEFHVEYSGSIAMAKRYSGILDVKAQAIYEGDVFQFGINPKTGRQYVIKHEQSLKNLGSKNILGAYAVIQLKDGSYDTYIMHIDQIRAAWDQGAMRGNSPAHKNFPDQMAMKTVINRACKPYIRGSDDSIFYSNENTINKATEDVYSEVSTKANKNPLDFAEDVTAEEVKKESPKEVFSEKDLNDPLEQKTVSGPDF